MRQPAYHPPVKRSITIAGHATSISLEPVFWDWLKAEAARRAIPVNALVAQIDLERMQSDTPPGLASAIRVWLAAQISLDAKSASAHHLTLRWADNISDYTAAGQLMFDAVHALPSPYSDNQRAAWMPRPRKGEAWNARLAAQQLLVAEDISGAMMGFMSLELRSAQQGGYVDFAYIATQARGSGLFRRLYEHIEKRAKAAGLSSLSTHASLMARPAFAAMGFTVLHEETVEMTGADGPQMLRRFAMEKPL
jgi:putative acetyltransferase